MQIFSFTDHLEVLRDRITREGKRQGYKADLAASAGVHPSFLSHVLKEKAQLSPDHAIGIACFWGLNPEEKEYFVELVNLARAVTPALREYFQARIQTLRRKNEKRIMKGTGRLLEGDAAKALYYSSWHYSAIHIALTIPSFQTPEALSKRFSVPMDFVERTLRDLSLMGLAQRRGTRWEATESNLAATGDHFARLHHVHWAVRAIQDIHVRRDRTSLYRTSVYGVSRKVFLELRQEMLKQIRQIDELAIPSPGEELICLNWHLFVV